MSDQWNPNRSYNVWDLIPGLDPNLYPNPATGPAGLSDLVYRGEPMTAMNPVYNSMTPPSATLLGNTPPPDPTGSASPLAMGSWAMNYLRGVHESERLTPGYDLSGLSPAGQPALGLYPLPEAGAGSYTTLAQSDAARPQTPDTAGAPTRLRLVVHPRYFDDGTEWTPQDPVPYSDAGPPYGAPLPGTNAGPPSPYSWRDSTQWGAFPAPGAMPPSAWPEPPATGGIDISRPDDVGAVAGASSGVASATPYPGPYLSPVPDASAWRSIPTDSPGNASRLYQAPPGALEWATPMTGPEHVQAASRLAARRAQARSTQVDRQAEKDRMQRFAGIVDDVGNSMIQGTVDMVTLPGRPPVPRPDGLAPTDSGWTIHGRPAEETPEGRAWLDDQRQRADWGPAMALNMLTMGRAVRGAPPGAITMFVGPKHAPHFTGGPTHPAVDLKRAISDSEALAAMERMRQAGDHAGMMDLFYRNPWLWARDGMPLKEIHDAGAKLVFVRKGGPGELGDIFRLEHPAGDFHGVYGIPEIVIGPRVKEVMGVGNGVTDPKTGQILIARNMFDPEQIPDAHNIAMEEVQHAINAKTGRHVGSDPLDEVFFQEYWDRLGQKMPDDPRIIQQHRDRIQEGLTDPDPDMKSRRRQTPEYLAAVDHYLRVIGEAEGQKARKRHALPELYLRHPDDIQGYTTKQAGIPTSQQLLRTQQQQDVINKAYMDARRRGVTYR